VTFVVEALYFGPVVPARKALIDIEFKSAHVVRDRADRDPEPSRDLDSREPLTD
jgi:hypothetical protein